MKNHEGREGREAHEEELDFPSWFKEHEWR
jgi:hypothetical protein